MLHTNLAPLTFDAYCYLCEGARCLRDLPRVPDGPRHYNAVQSLLAVGFIRYHNDHLAVTPMGRAYLNA